MGINILLRKRMGIFLYTTMGMGWEWEYDHRNRMGMGMKKSFLHISFRNVRVIKLKRYNVKMSY